LSIESVIASKFLSSMTTDKFNRCWDGRRYSLRLTRALAGLAPIAVGAAGGGVSHTKTVTAITPTAAKRVFEKASKLAGSFRSAGS
jgi:hypothetical protein